MSFLTIGFIFNAIMLGSLATGVGYASYTHYQASNELDDSIANSKKNLDQLTDSYNKIIKDAQSFDALLQGEIEQNFTNIRTITAQMKLAKEKYALKYTTSQVISLIFITFVGFVLIAKYFGVI